FNVEYPSSPPKLANEVAVIQEPSEGQTDYCALGVDDLVRSSIRLSENASLPTEPTTHCAQLPTVTFPSTEAVQVSEASTAPQTNSISLPPVKKHAGRPPKIRRLIVGEIAGKKVRRICGVLKAENGLLYSLLQFEDSSMSMVSNRVVNIRCPEIMIRYYEGYLKWQVVSA
ncbi:unnamed protein product, partial [Soboliphyme baturini]|uniref:ChSh domain-containing protein n=1 Tax=Soboliphyme baturini TaxID=241478 RepID=A0A183IXI7_9BILA